MQIDALVLLVAVATIFALAGANELTSSTHAYIVNTPLQIHSRSINYMEIDSYQSVRPSMSCSVRCRSAAHQYVIEGLHDRRGCSDKAVFDHERMDNVGKIREGRRLTGRVDYGSWNGVVCEEEDSSECAPSFKYVAAFSIGCERKEANGTVTETYKTYSYKELAKLIDHFM